MPPAVLSPRRLFPVFEWDDHLVSVEDESDGSSGDEGPTAWELELTRLLAPTVANLMEPEACSVLEEALVVEAASESSGQLCSPPPGRLAEAAPSELPSPQRTMTSGILRSDSRGSSHVGRHASTVISAGGWTFDGTEADLFASLLGLGAPAAADSFRASSDWEMGEGDLDGPASPGTSGASLDNTARTSSLYALNESGESAVALDHSFQLDWHQLITLGRTPTRVQLSSEQARGLPKVRFEAPDMQRCSICLENFRHGMLLTGLSCGHVFHVDCLTQWAQSAAQCPNCRAPIKPISCPAAR